MKKILSAAAVLFYFGNQLSASAALVEVKHEWEPVTFRSFLAFAGDDRYGPPLRTPSASGSFDDANTNNPFSIETNPYDPALGELVRVDLNLNSNITALTDNFSDVSGRYLVNYEINSIRGNTDFESFSKDIGDPSDPQHTGVDSFELVDTISFFGDDLDSFRRSELFFFVTTFGDYSGFNRFLDPNSPDYDINCCTIRLVGEVAIETVYVYDNALVAEAPLPASFWFLSIAPLSFVVMGWRNRTLQRKTTTA